MKTFVGLIVVTVVLFTRDFADACSCERVKICNKDYVISAVVSSSSIGWNEGTFRQFVGLDDVTVHRNSSAMDNLLMMGEGPCADMPVSVGSTYIFAGYYGEKISSSTVLDVHACNVFYQRVEDVDDVGSDVASALRSCEAKRNIDINKEHNKLRSFIKAALNGNNW